MWSTSAAAQSTSDGKHECLTSWRSELDYAKDVASRNRASLRAPARSKQHDGENGNIVNAGGFEQDLRKSFWFVRSQQFGYDEFSEFNIG